MKRKNARKENRNNTINQTANNYNINFVKCTANEKGEVVNQNGFIFFIFFFTKVQENVEVTFLTEESTKTKELSINIVGVLTGNLYLFQKFCKTPYRARNKNKTCRNFNFIYDSHSPNSLRLSSKFDVEF